MYDTMSIATIMANKSRLHSKKIIFWWYFRSPNIHHSLLSQGPCRKYIDQKRSCYNRTALWVAADETSMGKCKKDATPVL